MKAVHFGAGNIGRGFVGALLAEGGYEIVFSDVAADLVAALEEADSYTVHEVGDGGRDIVVSGFSAVNSAEDPERVAREIADADVVTCAVGPTVLKFIAPHVLAGIRARDADAAPVQVMACENAIGATDQLRGHITEVAGEEWGELSPRAVFANTAVDRIVPGQPEGAGIDVTVEPFFEWAIERAPFDQAPPTIPGAHFVDELGPYIERKLFTVNTGHAATAYHGARAGYERIADALADPGIEQKVARAIEETSAVLAHKHGFADEELAAYRATILQRFKNPALPDTVGRVGRQPLRKLSRHERFVGPAAEAAERGLAVDGLLDAIDAALAFDDPDDEQAAQLRAKLAAQSADAFTADVTGLDPSHPLYAAVRDVVAGHTR
ncbi:mannitol-1-phosphate 5-dehydrogenase [Microbacterium faecale]|uniref:Mannitol-1-phosphate 5-dehydrogenase n=1 Tax=Microbacterium faecale TaxID=1804630 RepID=A0A916Y984_9MICO|nr:mannitol-1-phosphate 5-dehydrogenase [Microbacterium faecale]GGD35031.1 mannitol-1-phosphate 5-dehydrogenase [Microbacterium faecale]